MARHALEQWSIDDADELYGVRYWSNGYFAITEKGELVARLTNAQGETIPVSLHDTVVELKDRGVQLPVLLRFGDILDARIASLNESFQAAIQEAGYRGQYRGVYPIKVNQQQQVIEEVCSYGQRYHHGLEAGSKAELIAALAYLHDPEALLICNGYKDEEFVDLALYGMKMGIRIVLVLEMPSELAMIRERSARMGVRPTIGLRMKLSALGSGHWDESSGDRSVFGLNSAQVIDALDELRAHDMLDCLQLLHFHIGSQISNIRNIRLAVSEAARVYVDLVREGAAMGIIDIGGGLAVDYDGSHTNCPGSRNYTMQEYCSDIVEVVSSMTDEAEVPHPTIVSESGRAIAAHFSVLLFNILDVSRFESHGMPQALPEGAHELTEKMMEVNGYLSMKNAQECFHDALFYRDEIRSLFLRGGVSLRERAVAEQIFWHLVSRIARELAGAKYVPDELRGLDTTLADTYYGNFSVFQSLPDAWAIEQLFPVMPIHRLNEQPTRKAVLSDMTCDCDGKLDHFIDLHDIRHTLPLHELRPDEDYILGVFLVGAYQETLGDLHNLLGDTNVVNVRLSGDGGVEYTHEIEGDSVADVLSYVEYDRRELIDRLRRLAESGVREGRITSQERRQIMTALTDGLGGYTYYES